MDEYLFCYAATHQRMLEGTYERSIWDAHAIVLKEFFANPGVAAWWDKWKLKFPPLFVSEIDNS
jgi:hypothetical protein